MATKRVILDFTDANGESETTDIISKVIELAGKSKSLRDYTIFNL